MRRTPPPSVAAAGQDTLAAHPTLFPLAPPVRPAQTFVPQYRIAVVRDGRVPYDTPQIRSAADASRLLHTVLATVDREHFVVLLLTQKHKVIGLHTVSVGSLTASVVHPRETFKAAILANAAALICGHNHPSGDCQPSTEDRALTTRLVEAGKLLGIPVLDHLIVGDDPTYFSFADHGLL